MMEFPITPAAVLTVVGIAAVTYTVTALLKAYLTDWRWTNALAWGIAFMVAVVAAVAVAGWDPMRADYFRAFMVGLFGVGLATFGREFYANMAAKLGTGPRADT